MPEVLRQDGFRVVIFPDDHEPAHVHVFRAGTEVKIDLHPLRIRERRGMSDRDVGKAYRIVRQHVALLLNKWEEMHGQPSR